MPSVNITVEQVRTLVMQIHAHVVSEQGRPGADTETDHRAKALLVDRFGGEGVAAWAAYASERGSARRRSRLATDRGKDRPSALYPQAGRAAIRRFHEASREAFWQATADPEVRRRINDREREVGLRTIWPDPSPPQG